jgi:hypothetical protein
MNLGYRIPALSASHCSFGDPSGGIPAQMTYLGLSGHPTKSRVLEAIRGCRTMVSWGPLAFMSIDGQGAGTVLLAGGGRRSVVLAAYALQAGSFVKRLELVHNGQVAESFDGVAGEQVRMERFWIEERSDAWYALKVRNTCGGVAWSAPIFFATAASMRPRAPLMTEVACTVVGPSGGALDARIEVLERSRPIEVLEAAGGKAHLSIPPTAAVRVLCPGYLPAGWSPFRMGPVEGILRQIHLGTAAPAEEPLADGGIYARMAREILHGACVFRLTPLGDGQ